MTKLRHADRRLLTILLIVFVQMLGASMILPILPLYAKDQFGLSEQYITLLGTAFFAAQFIAGPYLGRLSDKIGRLPVLIVSQIGTAVSFLMLALAPAVGWLFFARILDGITGGNIIVAQAYITDITPREKRTEALGYIFAVFGLGFIFGPAIGGLLAAAFGPRVPYVFASVAATAVVLLTWFTLDETLSPEQRAANRVARGGSISPGAIATNGTLVLILFIAFVGQFGLGMLQATFSLYGEAVLFQGTDPRWVNLGIGLLLALVGVGQVITQAAILPRALRRFDEAWIVVIGTILRTVALVLLAVVTSPWLAAPGSVLFAMGMGLMMPPLQSLTTTAVADELRGGVLGVYQSTISLSTIVSTAVAGTIFLISPTTPYWIGAGLTALVTLLALVLVRRSGASLHKQHVTKPAAPR